MFLKFIQLNLTYTLVMLLIAIILSIVNLSDGDLGDVASKGWQRIEMKIFTISHIKNKNLLWAHIIAAWVSSTVLGVLLYRNNLFFIRLRQAHFNSEDYRSRLHTRTLLLTHLPRHFRSDQGIASFLKGLGLLYSPEFCIAGCQVGHLPHLVKEYNTTIRQLEQVLARVSCSKSFMRPRHHLGRFGWLGVGPQVDSIDYYLTRLKELHNEIVELRTFPRDGLPVTRVGFAIYPDTASAHLVARQLSPGPGTYLTGAKPLPNAVLSPAPEDLIWSNLLLNRRQQFLRWAVFTAIFVGMVVGGAFLLLSLNPSAATVFTNVAVNSLLDSAVAPLLMLLAIFVVQVILRRLSEQQSAETHSSVERRLLAKFLAFLVCDNLIIFSSLQALPSVKNALNNVGVNDFQGLIILFKSLIPSLGIPFSNIIISTSSFWVSQMCLRILSYLAELIQPITLLRHLRASARRHGSSWLPGLATTPRALRELHCPTRFAFPIGYAIQSFNLTLLLVFGIVAPLIVPFSAANFTVAYIVYKHQLMYVHESADVGRDSGGRLYATAFHSSLIIWILSQFFLLLVMMLSSATVSQWYVLLPLPFILSKLGLAHRAWFDSRLDFIDLDQPAAPCAQLSSTSNVRLNPTAQEVEMAYINPARSLTVPTFSDGIEVGVGDAALTPSRQRVDSQCSTPSSFVHHHALDQELLLLEYDPSLVDFLPELETWNSGTAQPTPNRPSFYQLQSSQFDQTSQYKSSTKLTQTPHF
ncbi:hypothetical protein L0F63_002504 [Massospora cicadina]|nr:hypothetical protein L0F63_002504 [Massospora cicadina]